MKYCWIDVANGDKGSCPAEDVTKEEAMNLIEKYNKEKNNIVHYWLEEDKE